MNNNEEDLSKPLLIVSSIIPPVGLYLFIVNRKSNPLKAKKALTSGIIGVFIAWIMKSYLMPFLISLI